MQPLMLDIDEAVWDKDLCLLLGDGRPEATFASDPRSNSLDLIPLQIRQASARILGNSDLDNVDWDLADTTSSLLQALFRRNAARCFAALLSP